MTQLKSPTAGGTPSGVELQLEDLTREQKTVLSRIVHRFRESAVGQTIIGPPETGKSTLAEMVGKCLEEQAEPVLISKSQDPAVGHKRMMFEAYGSYPQFLSAVLKQLGFFVRGEESDLVEQLVEQLRKLRSHDKRLLLIIDDAHEVAPIVWKRLQPWLDYQDRGVRMIQVLLVGSSEFKKKMSESSMRGWRRWVHGTHELNLIKKWGGASDEARRMLKRACEIINEKTQPTEPIRPPQISRFAVQKIVKEAGGRPGRMTELLKRALSASIREGGCRISYRFLLKADALRSPAMQWYKLRQSEGAPAHKQTAEPKKMFQFSLRGKSMKERTQNPRIPDHPLGWMRYALGTLLVVFVLGAGWGITAWLSIDSESPDSFYLTEESEQAPVPEEEPLDIPQEPDALVEASSSFDVATSEPVDDYPLDVFDESWASIDPVAVSRAISASLEQEFMDLESSGIQMSDALPPREDATVPVEGVEAAQENTPDQVATEGSAATESESPLDQLEDFSFPERDTLLEEVVKTESKPLNADALDVSEELLHQTVTTGVVSVPPPSAARPPSVASTNTRAAPPPAPKPVATKPAKKPASRDRLLKAMSRLEKSLR